MADFNEYWNVLKVNIKDYAKENWKEYSNAVVKDGNTFLKKTKKDVERWTKLLAEGKLLKEDFEWLLKGKKDQAEMEALKQAGLARARIDRCRKGLLNVVFKTTLDFF